MEGDENRFMRTPPRAGDNSNRDPLTNTEIWRRRGRRCFAVIVKLCGWALGAFALYHAVFGKNALYVITAGLSAVTVSGLSCYFCARFNERGRGIECVDPAGVALVELRQEKTPKVQSKKPAVKQGLHTRVQTEPLPFQAHVIDLAVPGPSSSRPPNTDTRDEPQSGYSEQTSRSESAPAELQNVPEGRVTRSTAASRMSQAAASISQVATESTVRITRSAAARNEANVHQQASGGSGSIPPPERRTLRHRKSAADLLESSHDEKEKDDKDG